MKLIIRLKHLNQCLLMLLCCALSPNLLASDSVVQQWKQGLSGARLTSYSGSVISSNSTLTVINFCESGEYSYYREGSWSVSGSAAGASNQKITGRWDIKKLANSVELTYVTDQGLVGSFAIYLQTNGKVNVGGKAYAVQKQGAGC
jgi:hypothetical protein